MRAAAAKPVPVMAAVECDIVRVFESHHGSDCCNYLQQQLNQDCD